MSGLERMITKIMNTVEATQRRQSEPVRVPSIGRIEAESLYVSRLEALDAEERHIRRQLAERRHAPRWAND